MAMRYGRNGIATGKKGNSKMRAHAVAGAGGCFFKTNDPFHSHHSARLTGKEISVI